MADNFRYVQAQPFTLAGAGAVIGDTSVTLTSFLGIDGVALTMADFGTIGYGTLEPGSGEQEEQISFSGVTANANGTYTLTGVKNVAFISPYTETSGLSKTHPGGVQFVISNTAGFYNKLTSKNDDETITGLWDFPSGANNPTIGNVTYVAPTGDTQIATKKYIDDIAIAGAPKATEAVYGITRLSVAAVSPTAPIAVGDNDNRVSPVSLASLTTGRVAALAGDNTDIAVGSGNFYVTQTGLQKQAECYAASTTGNDTYVVTLSPVPTSLVNGMTIRFKPDTANTGAATLNVNSLGALAIVTGLSTPLVTGDILANQVCEVVYNSTGTVWQLVNPASANLFQPASANGTFSKDMSTTTTTTIAHGLGRTPKSVEIQWFYAPATSSTWTAVTGRGNYNGTTQTCAFTLHSTNGTQTGVASDTVFVHYAYSGTALDDGNNKGTVSIDATNITITWSKTNSPTGTAYFAWKADV